MTGDPFGRLLRSMSGPPDPQPGPPYAHVHGFPAEPDDGEPYEPPPPMYSFTKRGRQYEFGPVETPAAFRRLPAKVLPEKLRKAYLEGDWSGFAGEVTP